jgi:hypothetical protein
MTHQLRTPRVPRVRRSKVGEDYGVRFRVPHQLCVCLRRSKRQTASSNQQCKHQASAASGKHQAQQAQRAVRSKSGSKRSKMLATRRTQQAASRQWQARAAASSSKPQRAASMQQTTASTRNSNQQQAASSSKQAASKLQSKYKMRATRTKHAAASYGKMQQAPRSIRLTLPRTC